VKQEELVSDEFWVIVEPLLPEEPPKPRGGRPRLSDRAALAGIIYVLKSGIPWRMLPLSWLSTLFTGLPSRLVLDLI
jgi:transposase